MAITDISNLAISASFQNLLQRSGSVIGTATGTQIDSLDISASFAQTSINASTADTANTATSATSASRATSAASADSATSASYATTASYALRVDPVETGSLLQTASISDATITFEKADASTFDLTVNNVVSASHAIQADSATTATSASYASSATSASRADSAALADLATTATNATYADNTIVYGKNLLGSEIAKGTPLYFTASGTSGNIVGVYPADAGNASRRPAGGIAGETIAIGAEGTVLLDGFINGVDTTSFNSGDKIYLKVGSGYTNIAPTGSTNLIQFLGYVEKRAVNGSGVIQMSGESRAVPNIAQDNLWVGDSNGVAQPTDKDALTVGTASLALGVASGIDINANAISASSLSVSGTASIGYLQSITGSAKIIGDAFIILNADSPTERYAGIKVIDSGSLQTGSLIYDSVDDHWEYNSTAENYAAGFISGPTGSIGGTTLWPSKNSVLKGLGSNHIGDSNITDNGTTIILGSNTQVTGSLGVTGTIDGSIAASNVTGIIEGFLPIGGPSGLENSGIEFDGVEYVFDFDISGANLLGNADTATSATTATTAATASKVTISGDTVNTFVTTNGAGALTSTGATYDGAEYRFDLDVATDGDFYGNTFFGNADTATSASYATTAGSLTGAQTLDDIVVSGSARGEIKSLSIVSTTASMDCSTADFFTLTLVSGADTHLVASNIKPGQVISLKVQNDGILGDGTLSYSSAFKFAGGTAPTITEDIDAIDILTFISYDSTSLFGTSVQNLS